MPETAEELIDSIKGGKFIKCETVEQCREALRFFEDNGAELGSVSKDWLDSGSQYIEGYPHIGLSRATGRIGRFADSVLRRNSYFEFEDIAPILRGGTQPDYEIDAAVFDALFPS